MCSRVQIILSQFFQDHRKKVFVKLNPTWEHIKDLQDYVVAIFKLNSEIYFTSEDGVLFPKRETISIIEPNDVLIATPAYPVLSESKPPLEKKSEEIPAKTKKSKKKAKNPEPDATSPSISTQSTTITLSKPQNELSDEYDDDSIVFQAFNQLHQIEDKQSSNDPTSPIKKRTRIRKRKNKQKAQPEIEKKPAASAIVDRTDPPRKFRSETQEFWINPYPNRKHIKFDDDTGDENTHDLSNASQSKKARLLKPLVNNLQASEPAKLEESSEHKASPTQSVDMELESPDEECIVVEKSSVANTSSDAASSPVSVIEKKTSSKEDAAEDYSDLYGKINELDLPAVLVLPKKSDVVAFKMLKMNASYEPVVSNIIIGVVEEVEEASSEIYFLIKHGKHEFESQEGKFSLVKEENDNYDIDQTTWVNFKDMLEPKYCKLQS